MVKLFSVKEMIELEKEASASGLSYKEMMENAGRGIAEEIDLAYRHINSKKVVALVGTGNNGGDALVALVYLSAKGWDATAYIIKKRDPADDLVDRVVENRGRIFYGEQDGDFITLKELVKTSTVVVDGVLGTGVKLPLKPEIAQVLAFVREEIQSLRRDSHVVAVDCPSGVDCDTGEAAPQTIPAEMTITMAGMKRGLIKFPAAGLSGAIHYASIGKVENLNSYQDNKKFIITQEIIQHYLPRRSKNSHKGTFGTAFIIAGSMNFTGAALLAGKAAYRIGAGLVTLGIPEGLHAALAGQLPEATWVLLPQENSGISAEGVSLVFENIERATSLLLGPGFGLQQTTQDFLSRLYLPWDGRKSKFDGSDNNENTTETLEIRQIPTVVDADGLKLISQIEGWTKLLPPGTVLTPHPGEMAIITGLKIEEVQANRIEIAQKYSKDWGHIIVLKGAYTVIAEPEGTTGIVPVATAALAKAGTGDVLAGLITGLRAQKIPAFQAACAGAWIHGNAGLLAAKRLGTTASVLASDVLEAVPQILSDIGLDEHD